MEKLCRDIPVMTKERQRALGAFGVFKYALGAVFAVILLTSGAVVFADRQNVNYNNPFYTLKRIGEEVKLKAVPAESKPLLRDELARRRLEEIKQIKAQTEIKTKNLEIKTSPGAGKEKEALADLNKELHFQIKTALKEAQEKKISAQADSKLCESVSRTLREDKELIDDEEREKKESWSAFNDHCEQFMEKEKRLDEKKDENIYEEKKKKTEDEQ